MTLLLLVLGLSVCGVSGNKCYNTDPTRGKCLGYEEFPPSVMDNLFASTNYTLCVEECTKKPVCVGIQWNYRDKLCHPLEIELATQLEKDGSECLHFKKQSCEKKEMTGMTPFSDYLFKGGLPVNKVDSEDICKSICFRWEACSAYSWFTKKFLNFVGSYCYLNEKVPPNYGENVTGDRRQGIKKEQYVLETRRSYMFVLRKDYSRSEPAKNYFRRILECADFCARLVTCCGFRWELNEKEMNCVINYETLPMYSKKTLT